MVAKSMLSRGWATAIVAQRLHATRLLVAAIFVVALVAAALPLQAASPTIVFSGWGSPNELEGYVRELTAFGKAYPQDQVRFRTQLLDWNSYRDKLLIQAASGTLPDVMNVPGGYFGELAKSGAFLDLRPLIQRDKLDVSQFRPGALEHLTFDGKVYGLPSGSVGTWPVTAGSLLMYNRDIFDQSGLSYPQYDWSWNEFLTVSRKLTKDTNGDGKPEIWGTNIGSSVWDSTYPQVIWTFGGRFLNDEGTESLLDSAAVVDAVQFLYDLTARYKVSPPINQSSGDIQVPFEQGSVGMAVDWYGRAYYLAQHRPFSMGFSIVPKGPGGYGIFAGVAGPPHAYAIAANTRNPELAWKVVKFLVTSPEALRARGVGAVDGVTWKSLVPVYAEMIPANQRDVWEALVRTGTYAVPSAGDPFGNEYDEIVNRIVPKRLMEIYTGKSAVRPAMERAKADVDQHLKAVGRKP
ncbi:MAG: sugar ABC transporter substrate-binding protein [Limnochordaceae bacterium]|nr:sugar ABC transporter substrate-binding protein [Limnochordaceae bacterium]